MWDPINSYFWIFLAGVFTLGYWYIRNSFSFWAKRGVPFKKPHLIFGNFGDFVLARMSMPELVGSIYKEFKNERFIGIWNFFSPMLFPIDPTLIRSILIKDFETWSHRGLDANVEADPLAANLFNLNGSKWKSVRTKLSPTFTSGKLKQMHHLLAECGKQFEEHIENLVAAGGVVEAKEISARFATDVIGSCVFGIEMNSLSDQQSLFRKMGRKLLDIPLKKKLIKLLQANFSSLFKLLNLSTHPTEPTEFFLRLTKENFEYRDKNNVRRNDFIDLLRDLRSTGKPLGEGELEFNDRLLTAQAYVFFAAGFDTNSTAISCCLHELAINQDIQDRLREEVRKTIAASNGEITWDVLKNMKYLDMVIQETMRKHPPIPYVNRISVKPYRIPDTDVEIPAGTETIVPTYGLHHDPEYYPIPDKFDPERFTEESKSQRPTCVFLPFGDGPRHCIGLRFAEQLMKMALVKLVGNFRITLSEKSQNPLKLDPKARFLSYQGGIWVHISKY